MPPSATSRRLAVLSALVLLAVGAPAAQSPDLLWMRGGQAGGSNRAAWAPDGAAFAIAGDDGTVKVFDGRTRLLLQTIPVADDDFFDTPVFDVAYAPGGDRVGTTDVNNRVGVWDVGTAEDVWTVDVGTWAHGVAFSPDGALLAVGVGNAVQLRDADTGALVRTLPNSSEVIHTAFSPDGTRLAAGLGNRTVRIWRTADWTTERTLSTSLRFPEVAFSPDGSTLAAAGEFETFTMIRGELRLWDVASGQHLRTMPMGNHISNARYPGFSPDGTLVFAGHEYDGVKIFNAATGALVRHVPNVISIRLAPDGQTFMGQPLGCGGDWPPRWAAFTFPQGQLIEAFMTHVSEVYTVDVSDDGGMVASGAFYFDSAVRVWDAQTAERLHEYQYTCNSDGVTEVAFSPDGALVAGGGGDWDAEVRIWDRVSGDLVEFLDFGHNQRVEGLEFSPDGSRIAVGSMDFTLDIVDLSGPFIEHAVPTGQVADLKYSPDGSLLAVGTWLSGLRIVDTATGAIVRTIPAHSGAVRRVDFSSDGALVVSGGDDGLIKVWRVSDGALVRTITGHPGPVVALDLSPDDRHVVSGGEGPAKLWGFATGALLHTYDDETRGMSDAEFLPNGAAFAYTRTDATVGMARNPAAQAAVSVAAAPVGGPVTIPASGGSFQFTVTLTNLTGQAQTFQAWTAVTGPVSRDPVMGPLSVTLDPGATLTRTLTQQVPAAAPAGTYTYTVNVGTGGVAVAGDSFSFGKQAGRQSDGPAVSGADGWSVSGWESVAASIARSAPGGFALSGATPNPFTSMARLTLEIAEAQGVRAEVYDGLGRRVAVLHDGPMEPGAHALTFDGSALPAGLYVVRVTGETFTATRRATLAR
jgi:WD40 repeat protein